MSDKWCFFCATASHNDSECWSTRPFPWVPGYKDYEKYIDFLKGRIAELEAINDDTRKALASAELTLLAKERKIDKLEDREQDAIYEALEEVSDELGELLLARRGSTSAHKAHNRGECSAFSKAIELIRARIGTNPLADLQAKVREMEEQNAELRADAERLNYLEENQIGLYPVIQVAHRPTTATDGPKYEEYSEFLGWCVGNRADELPTVREAIDSHRQRAEQESEG